MANTYYNAATVLTKYAADNGYTVTNVALKFSGVKVYKIFVEEKDGVASLLCIQHTRTMFEIFGYGSDYAEVFRTSYDYADVNTPPLESERAYDIEE